MEPLKEKIERVLNEEIEIVPYNPNWKEMFKEERDHLLNCLPKDLINTFQNLRRYIEKIRPQSIFLFQIQQ